MDKVLVCANLSKGLSKCLTVSKQTLFVSVSLSSQSPYAETEHDRRYERSGRKPCGSYDGMRAEEL
jgi:hypothetical protein